MRVARLLKKSRSPVFIITFVIIGLIGLFFARAAESPAQTAPIEAEASAITPPAYATPEATASGGSMVVFNPTPARSAPISSRICGTWALQQGDNYNDFYTRFRFTTANAMAYQNLRGFSFRLPWRAASNNTDLVNQFTQADALINGFNPTVGRQAGKDYSIRFMAGRHTPQYVFDNGAYYYNYTYPNTTPPTNPPTPVTEKIPLPFSSNPLEPGGNPAFEAAFRDTVAALATYARNNKIYLLHLPWYGRDWSELSHHSEVRDPTKGYTYARWLEGHKRLIDIALEYTGPRPDGTDLAVEFPLSGAGPITGTPSPVIVDLANHIISKVGNNSQKIFFQTNGWGPSAAGWGYGDWGSPTPADEDVKDLALDNWRKPILRGQQAIQGENDYNWATMYDILRVNSATYAEVYVTSFQTRDGAGTTAQLATKITEFKSQVCN